MRLATTVLVLLLSSSVCAANYNDSEVIEYAKQLDVSRLDAELKPQPLETWLRLGPARIDSLRWRISDCDLKHTAREPADRRPLCVRFTFTRDNVSGWGLITVGTMEKGISGKAQFEYAVMATQEMQQNGQHETVTSLAELPPTIAKHRSPRDRKTKTNSSPGALARRGRGF